MSNETKKILGINSIPFIREYINASNAQIAEMVDNELKQYVDSKVQHMKNGISIFTSTIFIRTNATPEKPVGGSYDNPLPENSNWTDNIPNGSEVLWASIRVFASDGGELQQAEWSEPAKMTDTSDFEVIYSLKENPLQPTSDDFKRNNDGSISADWLSSNKDWTNDPTKESIWMATNTAKNGVWSTWKVSKIKGEDGVDGKDGDNIEFIYCLTKDENELPAPTEYAIEDNFVPEGWTNNPSGVDRQFKCEYFSMRKKAEGFWGNWSEPALWSKYGANGQDGDGVQYIYIKTTTNDIPANPTPEDYETNADYQSDSEWIPTYNENLEFQWTDDPQGVDDIVKYEWVASRKYRLNGDGTKKLWHPFSEPSLWAKYGEKGDTGDGSNNKIIMIYKSADSVEAPKDGAYDFDTNTFIVPDGWTTNLSELSAPIWMCSRIFSSVEELTEAEWSLPIKVTGKDGRPGQDGDTVEFIYYNTALNEVIDENFPKNSQEDKFIPDPWTDNPTGVSLELQYEFFSSRTKHNGVWSNWSYPALWAKYGEQGPQGPQGTPGKIGKITYPAGKYNTDTIYLSTNSKAPYVVDSDGEYYVLNENVCWRNGFCYYNDDVAIIYPEVYHYVSILPEDYDSSLAYAAQETGCTAENYLLKITTPSYSTVKNALGTTKKYYAISYKYSDTNRIIGNSIWKIDEHDDVVMISKFRYSTDGTKENIIGNLYNASSLQTPSTNSSSNDTLGMKVWEKFESFEAIYAKIAMIDNGTIGSAVYSGDYMFSQQGVDKDGNESPYFENFNPEHIYDSESEFKPNICMDFKNGQIWASTGNFKIDDNGNIDMNGDITLDGNISLSGDIFLTGFLKKNKTIINNSNYSDYITTDSSGCTYLDIKKTGTLIQIDSLPDNIDINLPYHKLPYKNTLTNQIIIDSTGTELMRQLFGTEIMIINDTNNILNIGVRGAMYGGNSSSGKLPLFAGCIGNYKLIFQATIVEDKNIEAYCWEDTMTTQTFSSGKMSNNDITSILPPPSEGGSPSNPDITSS